jgi:hypothetical protein
VVSKADRNNTEALHCKARHNNTEALCTSCDALHCGGPHEGRNGTHSLGSNDIRHAVQHADRRASRGSTELEGRNRHRRLDRREPAQSRRSRRRGLKRRLLELRVSPKALKRGPWSWSSRKLAGSHPAD